MLPSTRNVISAALGLWILANGAWAQPSTPTASGSSGRSPIRLIVPYPPGGGTDGLARHVGNYMANRLGRPVVIENRAGANTILATEYVAMQPADGNTLLYVAVAFAINPSLYKLRYSTLNDFAPVAMVARIPLIVLANNQFPVRQIADLLQLARKSPGKISYATYGTGSPAHLAAELLAVITQTQMLHIPYRGSAPALADLVGKQVDLSFSSIEPALPLVRSGKVRAIAVTTATRIAVLPHVPSVSETVPGFETVGWNAILAPKGTPSDVVRQLADVINEATSSPETRERFTEQGIETDIRTPESMAQMIRSEIAKWEAVVKRAHVKVE